MKRSRISQTRKLPTDPKLVKLLSRIFMSELDSPELTMEEAEVIYSHPLSDEATKAKAKAKMDEKLQLIAREFQASRERIRQLESKAFARLTRKRE